MSSITQEYFKLQQEYETKYGERTLVLMQVGSFFEAYEYNSDDDTTYVQTGSKHIGHSAEIAELLNMILTSKDKGKAHTMSNPYLVGFPVVSYERHRDVLLAHDYTLVRVDQDKQGPQLQGLEKKITRHVAEIISPATFLDSTTLTSQPSNQIVSVFIECQKAKRPIRSPKDFEDLLIIAGLSTIDVSTGKNTVCETYSAEQNPIHALQEIYRFLVSHNPREVLINVISLEDVHVEGYRGFLTEMLELTRYPTVIMKINELTKNLKHREFLKVEYHKQFLMKVFHQQPKIIVPQKGPRLTIMSEEPVVKQNNVLEELDVERFYYGTVSYVILLQYCYEHNENLILRVEKPETTWIDSEKHLQLTHNAILQLHLVPAVTTRQLVARKRVRKFDSVFAVVNNTSTALGKRYLHNMLLNPITNPETLSKSYQMTDELLLKKDLLVRIETILGKVPDIERLQRKVHLGNIRPMEFVNLIRSYFSVVDLFKLVSESQAAALSTLLFGVEDSTEFNDCLKLVMTMLDLDKLSQATLDDNKMEAPFSFLLPSVDPQADAYAETMVAREKEIESIVQHLNNFIAKTRGNLIVVERNSKTKSKTVCAKKKDDENEDEDTEDETVGIGGAPFLHTTNAKGKLLQKAVVDTNICGVLGFRTFKSSRTIITSPKIDTCCYELEAARVNLMSRLSEQYRYVLETISKRSKFFVAVQRFIGMLDFFASNARTAIKYKYFKPTIVKDAPTSFMIAKDIRHSLVERIIETEYIPNDVSLGECPPELLAGILDETQLKSYQPGPIGRLLYGLNSCGKTTITRAIGVVITLAQAGLYTPCQLIYKPFTKILTRLTGNDDLLKGHSSFIVEMMELRTILRNADCSSLVLCDELTRGTETVSGSALTVATILTLLNRKTPFIMSTHMHHLPETPHLSQLDPKVLKICHLTTTYDEDRHLLIFDRKLKEGQGKNSYGIEVAKSVDLDKDFIKMANDIRRHVADISPLILDPKKSRYNAGMYVDMCTLCGKKIHLETHHLKEQHTADKNGFINHLHKNHISNLTSLCHDCHTHLHAQKKQIVTRELPNGNLLYEIVNE